MKNTNPTVSIGFAVTFTLFTAFGANAAEIASVAASPSSAQADFGSATPVTVAWVVIGANSGNITSEKGIFRTDDGKVLGTVSTPIAKAADMAGGTTITETLTVPPNIMVRAHLMGSTQIRYERDFSNGGALKSGSMALYAIVGAGANRSPLVAIPGSDRTFDISRFALRFSDNGVVATVNPGTAPRATAKARFTANRIVNATWEIAGPNPGDDPKFQNLGEITQLVEPNQETVFNSPVLPTDKAGTYLLRLAITTPTVEFEEPVIRYFVTGGTLSANSKQAARSDGALLAGATASH